MARTYLEFADDAELARWQEADGRAYAADAGKPYPYPSDVYGPGCEVSRRPEHWIRYRTAVTRDDNGGGVVEVDPEVQGRLGRQVRLGDATDYQMPAAAKPRAALHRAARDLVDQRGLETRVQPAMPARGR